MPRTKKKPVKIAFTVMIERTQVILARSPQEAREIYLKDLNAPTCLKVYKNVVG